MPVPASLLPFSPDTVVHGSEITLQVMTAAGAYVTIGELYDLTWTEDQGMVEVMPFSTRLNGQRRGRYKVTGTFTGYYINGVVRSMIQGYGTPATAGVTSAVYHSQEPFYRYQIKLTSTNTSMPAVTFYNVTLGKDVLKLASDKVLDETIDFGAEDVFAY